jgi:hypothetical protein
MIFAQGTHQVFLRDMRVPLGGGDGCVTQELLDHSNVRAIPQKQCCNRVPQHVWCDVPLYPGLPNRDRPPILRWSAAGTIHIEPSPRVFHWFA